ncbi:MAG TPA: hypothetical protein VFO27_00020 [Bryobacteraceae bacterium]|nr:hypothetical protein [Bryobacteraceae bacterium]
MDDKIPPQRSLSATGPKFRWRAVDCRHHKNGHIRIWSENGQVANVLRTYEHCEEAAKLFTHSPELLQGATAAWHMCQSLLRSRDGLSNRAIEEIARLLQRNIHDCGGEVIT